MTLTDEEIVNFLNDYDRETKAIKKDALKLSWFMRGGVTYDDIMYMSTSEREWLGELIKDNLEVTKKSGLPYF